MIDSTILEAIDRAGQELGQPRELARQITTWLKCLAAGSETLDDSETVSRRCETLFSSVVLEEVHDGE